MQTRKVGYIDPKFLAEFPDNVFVRRLIERAVQMEIHLIPGEVSKQWLYHPAERVLCVWTDDLRNESLSFLVVILAHEIGHAMDFDSHPELVKKIKNTHWSEMPDHYEARAFVNGYQLIRELDIPISEEQYLEMIDEPMASKVRELLHPVSEAAS